MKFLKWFTIFIALSCLIVAVSTSFTFADTEIQLYNTYYVINTWHKLILLVISFSLIRSFYLLIDYLLSRSRGFAIAFSILNGLTIILMMVVTFLGTEKFVVAKRDYPDLETNFYLLMLSFMIAVIGFQIWLEVKAIIRGWVQA